MSTSWFVAEVKNHGTPRLISSSDDDDLHDPPADSNIDSEFLVTEN